MKLVIGNRNYSSWSLRAWLAVRFAGLAPEVVRIPLDTPEFGDQIRLYSAAAQVPVLIDGDLTIWDSLAICEYVAEHTGHGWPAERGLRTHARCAVSEMHSGFAALRDHMPMNIRARRTVAIDAQLTGQIERVIGLWCEALTLHDDERAGLYGPWGIADAFWAPVAFRFRTYGVAVPELAALWMERLFEHPEVRDWCALAEIETEVLEAEETGDAR